MVCRVICDWLIVHLMRSRSTRGRDPGVKVEEEEAVEEEVGGDVVEDDEGIINSG